MPVFYGIHSSRVSERGVSVEGLAGLGFLTGVLISLLVYLAVWLIKHRRYAAQAA